MLSSFIYGFSSISFSQNIDKLTLPYVAAENVCGSGGSRALTVIVSQGGGGGIILITTPNPASDEFDVSLDEDTSSFTESTQNQSGDAVYPATEKVYYSLYDQSGREVFLLL